MHRVPGPILAIGFALALNLSGAAYAETSSDTPESRMAAAQKLVDLQWPETKRSILDMLQSYEAVVPPEHRQEVQDSFTRNFDFEEVRGYSAAVLAKDLSLEEIEAMITFYSSPLGRSVMTKMPQVMQDTIPVVQGMMMKALKRPPPGPRPQQPRNL